VTTCARCGITVAEVRRSDGVDYFTPVGSGSDLLCTTCIRWAELDSLQDILSINNRRHRILRDRLALAENVAAMFADHLKGCQPTRAEEDAVIEWHHAAGIQAVPEDDALRSEL
jgi:hypothetical protein